MTDDVEDRRVADLEFAILQAVLLDLLRQQIAPRNVLLLVLGVAGQPDHLHAVEERRRDIQRVGGADEHDLGQVEIDLEVMVGEGRVLLRIEHFEQRR